jgi:16S rRNA G527 N7-methylase RsmG
MEFEIITSHLDETNEFEPIYLNGQPMTVGQYGYEIHPVIYPSGLVMLNPRWDENTYNEFYKNDYDALYALELKPDVGIKGIEDNYRKIYDRWNNYFREHKQKAINILDIGSGPGFGLIPIKDDYNISVIESSSQAKKKLISHGFRVIADKIEDEWVNEHNSDFIIMRHVAEHFLDPVFSFKHLKKGLGDEGLIYISVPDMLNPRTKLRDYNNWWEYWFRNVHTYYWTPQTLQKTLSLAGLKVVKLGQEDEEIFCFAQRCDDVTYDYDYYEHHQTILEVLEKNIPNL